MSTLSFTIRGEPASKASSREIVTIRTRDKRTSELQVSPRVRKSDHALAFERAAQKLTSFPTVEFRIGIRSRNEISQTLDGKSLVVVRVGLC